MLSCRYPNKKRRKRRKREMKDIDEHLTELNIKVRTLQFQIDLLVCLLFSRDPGTLLGNIRSPEPEPYYESDEPHVD